MKKQLSVGRRGPWLALLAMMLALGLVVSGCAEKAKQPSKDNKRPDSTASDSKPVTTEPKTDASKPEDTKKPEPPKAPEETTKPEDVKKPEEPAKPTEPTSQVEPPKPAAETPVSEVVTPSKPVIVPEETVPPIAEEAKPAPVIAANAGDAKVSAYAPAEDLAAQLDTYLKDLGKAVATEDDYKDAEDKIEKDANTLIVVALALGLHDEDSKYKKPAASLLKASQNLAGVKGFADAKKAVDALVAAAEGNGPEGPELKWEKLASLPQLMKAVPLINTKLKRNTDERRFKTKAKEAAGNAAVIAAIAQASIADHSEAKTPEQVKQWEGFCVQMRDAAGELNKAIRARDEAAANEVLKKLGQSCDDCHAVFHKEALGK